MLPVFFSRLKSLLLPVTSWMIAGLTASPCALAQEAGASPAPPGQDVKGALAGAGILLVILAIYTFIPRKEKHEGGCARCTCSRDDGSCCEKEDGKK